VSGSRTIRNMSESDCPTVVRSARRAALHWSEVFFDGLPAGVNYFLSRRVELGGMVVGHGVMSVAPPRAHCQTFASKSIIAERPGGRLTKHLMARGGWRRRSGSLLEARPRIFGDRLLSGRSASGRNPPPSRVRAVPTRPSRGAKTPSSQRAIE